MASYSPLATAIISLATASFDRDGFGIPAFFTPHRYTKNRVLIVTADSYGEELPTGSPAYEAAKTAFEQPNGLSQLYIARVEANQELTVAGTPVVGDTYTITVEVNDGDKIVVTHTATGTPSAETVLTAIAGTINGDTDVADHITVTVVGSGAAAKMLIAPTLPTDFFISTGLKGLVETYITTESAAEAYTAIEQENDGFYAITTSDKTEAWLLALADEVNAREKQFWVSVEEQGGLSPVADPASHTLAKLKEQEYLRVVAGYHQDAKTSFPELGALAYNLVFPAGTIVWGNDRTSGIPVSQNAAGFKLTTTQKQNLLNHNAFFWDNQGGITFFNSDVKSSNGERPENVRGKDNMVVDIQAAVSELMLNQVGGKIPYTNQGILQIVSVLDSVLQVYVQRGFINGDYVITSPDARLIVGGIKATQKLDGIKFTAQLTGAITMVDKIQGVLQLDEVLQ